MANVPVDPSRCPLCGRGNDCGLATGTATTCWCFAESVPSDVAEKFPSVARGLACVCRRCARAMRDRRKALEDLRRHQELFRRWR
ncbi:MAG: cysteine-rich CWC family protein [Actinomycetota bacterium]